MKSKSMLIKNGYANAYQDRCILKYLNSSKRWTSLLQRFDQISLK